MQKVLRKRVFRDLKANAVRYAALALLVLFSMYIVVSLIGAAETIIRGSKEFDEAHGVEDGEFSLFAPMTDAERTKLTEAGLTLEEEFFLEYTTDEGKTIRVFKNREMINTIGIVEGTLADAENELVIERQYAEDNAIEVGDRLMLGGRDFTVTGIGVTPDYDSTLKNLGDTTVDSMNFGTAFVTEDMYDTMLAEGKSAKSEEYVYAYRLNGCMTDAELKEELKNLEFTSEDVQDAFFKEYWDRTMGQKDDLTDGIDELFSYDAGNLMTFVKAEDNVRIQAASGDQELYLNVGMIAGVILLILISYVLSVFVVHTIDQESAVIGSLYALGVTRKNLMAHYVMLPATITGIAGAIGTLIGYTGLGVPVQMAQPYAYYSLPDLDVVYMPYLFVYGIVLPPVVSVIVNSLVIRKRLSKPVLTLIKNEQKVRKGKDVKLKDMSFMRLFKVRQMLRETRTGCTVVFGIFVSMLMVAMALEIYIYCKNVETDYVADTKYEYMYTYKYPTEEVPEGGYKAYAKTLKKSIYGYNFDVTVLGLTENNPYFDVTCPDSANEVVISSSIAYKYGLGVGDVITLNDEENDKIYAFDVIAVTQYAPSFMVFMDYEEALSLFGEADDYFNVVFSDHALEIESGRLYNTTTKADIEKAAGVFSDQMQSMILIIGFFSAVIFIIVLYLMMKVMIDRSSFHIALIKIFGYRDKEVKKMYLDGNFYIVTIGTLVSIPLSKLIMDAVYEPAFVPNVACGIDKSFPWWIYVGIFVCVLVLYFIINHSLIRRIRKMVPAEVLKNRE